MPALLNSGRKRKPIWADFNQLDNNRAKCRKCPYECAGLVKRMQDHFDNCHGVTPNSVPTTQKFTSDKNKENPPLSQRQRMNYTMKSSATQTSRERPKSAPYPRLKNSKRTSKCQVFSSTVPA